MFDTAREEVGAWLNRPLEPYYPIVMIDAFSRKELLVLHLRRLSFPDPLDDLLHELVGTSQQGLQAYHAHA